MSISSKKICLFGPQGSGKGTQAEKLSEYFDIPHIAPGNIFRAAIADGSELGKQVESVINVGRLVPDVITNRLVEERLKNEDCVNGFVLDGYPRNTVQANALDTISNLTHVLVIDIPNVESIRRISERRVCLQCGATYHTQTKPPIVSGTCDHCGKKIIQRDDDKPEAIKKRLDIYHKETEPLFRRYADRGILHMVDGTRSIEEVWQGVRSIVE